jgi:hypothetical protein
LYVLLRNNFSLLLASWAIVRAKSSSPSAPRVRLTPTAGDCVDLVRVERPARSRRRRHAAETGTVEMVRGERPARDL